MKSKIFNNAILGQVSLVAEIGVNFYDIAVKESLKPLDAALYMIQKAKESGVDAVKFQSYKAKTLASKYSPSYWDITMERTCSQFELFSKYDSFSCSEFQVLSDYCNSIDIEFLSTPFDEESTDYLYTLMNVYKISSSDITNLPFIEYIAKKGKPIILSTGASTELEIDRSVELIREKNNEPLALLHCVLEYPTPFNHANLNRIIALKCKYKDLIIGYSDHTKPDEDYDVITTAYNLGALIIEKHFTLDKTISGNDHYHAMDSHDAYQIKKRLNFIDSIRGSYMIDFHDTEILSRKNARRSIVAKKYIKKGTVLSLEELICKRPGIGIPPSHINEVIGKISKEDIPEDTIISMDMIE